jgi:hypothetical protein
MVSLPESHDGKEVYHTILVRDKLGYIERIAKVRKELVLSSDWDDESIVRLALDYLLVFPLPKGEPNEGS